MGFPKCNDIDWWYINLDHRQDRREHIEKQCAKVGIHPQRFPAMRLEHYCGDPNRVRLMQATPNTIGNWLSHSTLWRKASSTGKCIGVLEDDALLCSDFQERMQYIHENFHDPWDIFFLGGTYHVNPAVWHKDDIGRDFELTSTKHIHRMYGAFSNQGYVINPASGASVANAVDAVMIESRGIDHALIKLQPLLDCYNFTPGMVFQIDGPSDIGQGITRFSHFLESLGPYVWCDRLEDFDYDNYEWAEGRV